MDLGDFCALMFLATIMLCIVGVSLLVYLVYRILVYIGVIKLSPKQKRELQRSAVNKLKGKVGVQQEALIRFIDDAINEGRSEDDVVAALKARGWETEEILKAVSSYKLAVKNI